MDKTHSLDDTLALMRDLRKRCEWDAAQTHESLRPYLIEEANELDDAIRLEDDAAMREELGGGLLQVLRSERVGRRADARISSTVLDRRSERAGRRDQARG